MYILNYVHYVIEIYLRYINTCIQKNIYMKHILSTKCTKCTLRMEFSPFCT